MLSIASFSQFFTDYGGYIIELLFSIGLFSCVLERKRNFVWHMLAVIAAMFAFSLLCAAVKPLLSNHPTGQAVYNIIRYLVIFAIGFIGILLCFDSQHSSAMFCMVCATATQHLSYRIYSCVLSLTGMRYTSPGATAIITLVSAAVYLAIYFIFVQRLRKQPEQHFENKLNILVGGILIMAIIVLHFFVETQVTIDSSPTLFIFFSLHSIISCVLTLMIEHGLFRNNVLANDKELLERLIHQHEEQYHVSKDSMDMINIKCHDMKHQITQMTTVGDHEAIQELERIINIYDSNLKTGNEILDVCLMEKKLLCERNNIKFDCIANGACLSFMHTSDIFSLFGNAMENAIEASCKVSTVENRIISMNVRSQLGMVVIHLENNYEGDLQFTDGLPTTTKEDEHYHGFGMRSIQLIAESYKGNVAVLAANGVFNLNITIPISNGV